MKRPVALLLILLLAAIGAYFLRPYFTAHDRLPEIHSRIATLKSHLTDEPPPCPPGNQDINDLSILIDLKQHPYVVQVEAHAAKNPIHRIIHFRDWHFVPKGLFEIDLRDQGITNQEEIDALYEELLLQVELVQREQMAILRCLTRNHGLRKVFIERLTDEGMPNFQEMIDVLRNMKQNEIPKFKKQLEEARKLKGGGEIVKEIEGLLEEHHRRLLEIGAAGRLLIAGEIEEVLPLDDAKLLDKAKPITSDGKVRFDQMKVEAREDAQVKRLLKSGPVAVIILGGMHDLSDNGGDQVEYLRLTTEWYREFGN